MKKIISMILVLVMVLTLLAACTPNVADPSGSEPSGSAPSVTTGNLSAKLEEFGFRKMVDLAVGDLTAHGEVELNAANGETGMKTTARTVSHGSIYTAFVTAPIQGEIKKGDTIVMRVSMKNNGTEDTNFLVDIYHHDQINNRVKDSWLTRNIIISPTAEYVDYYFYAVALQDTNEAVFEINMGFAAQDISVNLVEAAKYNGTLKETFLENLPLMSRNNVGGENHWHTFYAADASWRETAQQMVQENRVGDLVVNVTDASGNKIDGATVLIEMVEHTYKFGSAGFGGIDTDYFNLFTFANSLKWSMEGFSTQALRDDNSNTIAALKDQGVDVHGHVMFWGSNGRDPYADGIENTAEFYTAPYYIGHTTSAIQVMQRMRGWTGFNAADGTPIVQGYDGTVGVLRQKIDEALNTLNTELARENNDKFYEQQFIDIKAALETLKTNISGCADEDTTIPNLDAEIKTLQDLVYNCIMGHLEYHGKYYASENLIEWDVINEAMNEGNRGTTAALDQDTYFFTRTNVCQDQFYVDAFKAARKGVGENVKLGYNDTSWQSNGQQRTDTYNFFKYLVENDAPIDYFGLQAYMYPQSIQAHLTPEEMWAEFDKFMELGIETEVTEYSITGFDGIFETQTQLDQLQADFTYDTLLAHFAHESSIGFIAWGGLASHGPVASAWYKVAYNEWWTNETVETANGSAAADAYLGSYKITVTVNGQTQTVYVDHANAHADGTATVVDVVIG